MVQRYFAARSIRIGFAAFISISIIAAGYLAQSVDSAPGGVANLVMWLDGNDDATFTESSGFIDQWSDKSGNSNHVTASGGNRPSRTLLGLNNNDVVAFDGSDDYLSSTNTGIIGSDGAYTKFVVYRVDDFANANNLISSTGTGNHALFYGGDARPDFYHGGTFLTGGNSQSLNEYYAMTARYGANVVSNELNINGQQEASATGTQSHTDDVIQIGGFADGNVLEGYIAEVLVYDAALTQEEINEVESYLHLKWGLTRTAQNYGATVVDDRDYFDSGATVVWDYSTNSGFHNDVFGIFQDDTTGVDQTTASSSSSDGLVQFSNASSQDDGDFLIAGNDDNESTAWTTTNAPATYNRLGDGSTQRQWRAQETGDLGNVTVTVDSTDLPAFTGSLYLLPDNNDDNDLSNDTPLEMTNVSGTLWSYSYDFSNGSDGQDFTIAYGASGGGGGGPTTAPGGVSTNLQLWLDGDDIDGDEMQEGAGEATTSAGDVTSWEDKSSNNASAVLYNGAQGGSQNLPAYDSANGSVIFDRANSESLYIAGNVFGDATVGEFDAFVVGNSTIDSNGAVFSVEPRNAGTSIRSYLPLGDLVYWDFGTERGSVSWGGTIGSDYIWNFRHSVIDNLHEVTRDAAQIVTGTTSATFDTTGTDFIIAKDADQLNYWGGELEELVIFDRHLDSDEREQVQSYLAIKNGITLEQFTPRSYYSSSYDGTDDGSPANEKFWDGSTNASYNNDIAGIGQDDASGLLRSNGISKNDDAIVSMHSPAGQDDLEFVVWGNDDNALNNWTATNAPAGYLRLGDASTQRTWRAVETGDVGTVTVTVDENNANAVFPNFAGSMYLLVDTDDDMDLSDETPVLMYDDGSTSGDTVAADGIWSAQLDIDNGLTNTEGQEFSFAIADSTTLYLTSPQPYQVFQRDGSNMADIAITGTYTGTCTSVEAQYNSGGYSVIDAAPSGNTFSGALTGQMHGAATLDVRCSNAPAVTESIMNVGIGEVLVLAGQSNNVGFGQAAQEFTGTPFASVFDFNDAWKEADDPIHTTTAIGSQWPLLANTFVADQNVPIAFISTAVAGAGLHNPAQWPKSSGTLYTDMVNQVTQSGVNSVRAVLWHQGETDAANSVTRADYNAALDLLASDIASDLPGAPVLVVAQIGEYGGQPDSQLDEIRLAQSDAWFDNAQILAGPTLYDIDLMVDDLHFASNAELQTLADRWWTVLDAHFYGGSDAVGPVFASAATATDRSSVTVTFTESSLPILPASGLSTAAFEVALDGTPQTISSVDRGANDEIVITLSSAMGAGTVTVSMGSGNTSVGLTVPTDSSTDNLVALPFIDETAPQATGLVEFTDAIASDNEATGGNLPSLTVSGGVLSTDQSVEVTVTGGSADSSDFTFTSPTTITIPSGNYTTPQAVAITGITIDDDTDFESDETIVFGLQNPSSIMAIGDADSADGAETTHTYTIANDDLVDTDGDNTPDASDTNDDNDSIDDAVEDAAPNSGDANDDGMLDSIQANVASVVNAEDDNAYVTLASSAAACSTVSALSTDSEANQSANSEDFEFPVGLVDFTLDCTAPGDTTTVTLYFDGITSTNYDVVKFDGSSYAMIPGATKSIQSIGGVDTLVVQYSITDGSSLDADGVANGTIVDPVGLANDVAGSSDSNLAETGQNAAIGFAVAASVIGIALALTRVSQRSFASKKV